MSLSIAHTFVSAIADDPAAMAAGEVLPSNWNAAHTITGGTSGSVLFVNGSNDLAQDNTKLFWDDTNFALKLGDAATNAALYLNAVPALFEVPHASGNNWFEGNAGNSTLTGSGNFGTGDTVLSSLTTGSGNLAIGGFDSTSPFGLTTAQKITTGGDGQPGNVAIGASALGQLTSGFGNVAVGARALEATGLDSLNIAIGPASLKQLGSAGAGGGGNNSNIALGNAALSVLLTGTNMIGVGDSAANFLASSTGGDAFIGAAAGFHLTTSGGFNTLIGNGAGFLFSAASNITLIGGWLGAAVSVSNIIALSCGNRILAQDFGYTLANIWSYQNTTTPVGQHIYNTTDSGAPPTDYERAVFDWNIVANVLVIGTQKGGTGSTRNLEFIIGGTNELDYGVTNAGLWTFAQATMFATSVALTNGAAAQVATMTNGPAAGNPTKWIPINDNGTTRFIPAW